MSEPVWIEDSHKLHFRLDKAEVTIFYVECPNKGKVALCNKNRDNCVVDEFASVYGSELNIGSTFIYGPVEIAWTPILGSCDIDNEFSQIWVIPIEDQDYKAFKILN